MTAALLDFCRLFAGFSSDPCWFFARDVLQTCLEIVAFLLGCMAYGASMKHAERRHAPSGQFALADQGHFAPCIIAGRTAINFWLHSDKRIEPLSKSACNKLIRAATPSLFTDDMSETLFGEPPFEILVADASSRRNRRKVRCLTSSCGLPSRSLAMHDASTAICTPAFAFCQVNRKLPLIKSIELGTDLCASYWLDMFGDVQQRQYRLATKSALTRFTESNTALYGSRQAREALRWVRDGSASPMETKLMLLLSLPQRLGGYGFSGARFNYQVNLGNARSRINQSFFRIDIAFPNAKIGIEYDSAAFHRDFSKDRRRINALESLGWTIFSVDKQQLLNTFAMERTAKQIAKLMGTRIRMRGDWHWRYSELRRQLSL